MIFMFEVGEALLVTLAEDCCDALLEELVPGAMMRLGEVLALGLKLGRVLDVGEVLDGEISGETSLHCGMGGVDLDCVVEEVLSACLDV